MLLAEASRRMGLTLAAADAIGDDRIDPPMVQEQRRELRDRTGAQRLHQRRHCVRENMEYRTKECQLNLFADRTSPATLRANQLRRPAPRRGCPVPQRQLSAPKTVQTSRFRPRDV